jgi:hypothetical protein
MTRLLLLPKKPMSRGLSMKELIGICQDIDSVDTYRNVINSTEICDLTEKTITPSNRGLCGRAINKESFLISKN